MRIVVSGDNDHRNGGITPPENSQTGETVDPRQTKIKQDEIEILLLFEQGAGAIAIGRLEDTDLISKLAQGLYKAFPNQHVIFDNKQFEHDFQQIYGAC
jgi:hypothetical protein